MTVEEARAQVRSLVEKYALLDAIARGAPGRTDERRDAIRAVADRFPGAMREYDALSPEALARRRSEAERALVLLDADPEAGLAWLDARAWMRLAADAHERLREALRIKRWLAGRTVDESVAAEATRCFAIDRARLIELAGPGLTDRIYGEVAVRHGISVEELKAALFGAGEGSPSAGSSC